jgi:hypothetical protein
VVDQLLSGIERLDYPVEILDVIYPRFFDRGIAASAWM